MQGMDFLSTHTSWVAMDSWPTANNQTDSQAGAIGLLGSPCQGFVWLNATRCSTYG
jgi:hypothetical protein